MEIKNNNLIKVTNKDIINGTTVIPANITEINEYAFAGTDLKFINIPEHVNKIGNNAFYGCKLLETINIPNNVTEIGNRAFGQCYNLKAITLSNNITEIQDQTFISCHSLEAIDIPSSITKIEEYAFCDCSHLKTINIPESVTEIQNYAFKYCNALETINIPNSVIEIGTGAFYECYNLKVITLSNNITEIQDQTFEYCHSLEAINIPNSVTKIEDYAFCDCINLKSINIPENVNKIGNFTFSNCSYLKTIDIPESVTEIGNGAFMQCYSLELITIPNTIKKIQTRTFESCYSLKTINIPSSVTTIENYAFYNCINLKLINMNDKINSIEKNAFSLCYNLQSLVISSNIKKIENNAFNNCPKLDTIIVSKDTIYTDLNNICEQVHNDNGPKYFNINLNSSLFNIIKSISHSDLSIDSVSNYVINDFNIYNTPINSKKFIKSYKHDIEYDGGTIKQIISNTYIDKIRKNELLDKIKDKLEHNNITNKNYFTYSEHQNIINTIIYNINNSTDYNYRKDLEQYIKEYIKNKKTSLITLNTMENNFNNKNIPEVTNDLKNYKLKELNNNEYMELFNFGNDFNIYPLYISTTIHNTVTHFSKDIKIHQIKQKFDELTTSSNKENFLKKLFFKYDNDNITLNKEILKELNNSINSELINSEKEIQILNELKKLIINYIKKLEEHINYLENYNLGFVNPDIINESDLLLKNNIKIEKIESFKSSIILIQEKYIQINLIINSNLIYMDKLNNLRINLLPNLISKIMTNNVIKKDIENIQEFIEISNTLNEIINSQDDIESNNCLSSNNEKNKQFYKKS